MTAVEYLKYELNRRQAIIDSEPIGIVKESMYANLYVDLFEQALALKKLGFDEPCFAYYNVSNQELIEDLSNNRTGNDNSRWASAPLYQQAFRWLLDKHYLYGIVLPTLTMNWTFKTMTVVEDMVEVPPYIHVDANDYSTREDAELECLKKLIKMVKK